MNQKPQHQVDDIDHLTSQNEEGQHGLDPLSHKEHVMPNQNKGELFVLVFFFLLSACMIALIPVLTSPSPEQFGWYASPRIAPVIGLSLMFIPLVLYIFSHYKPKNILANVKQSFGAEKSGLLSIIKLSLLFLIYIFLVVHIGYLFATLIFTTFCLYYVGLRERKYIYLCFGFTMMCILIFRVGLQIWLPTPTWYTYLPDYLVTIFSSYF